MKKIILFIILYLSFIESFSQISKFQRVAIPKVNFELPANGKSKEIPSFCTDHSRNPPPSQTTNFDFVQIDEKCVWVGNSGPYTVQEAIDNKYIDVIINGFESSIIVNLTDKPIKISSKKSIVLGDTKNDTKKLFISEDLSNSKLPQEIIQENYWDKQEQVTNLLSLGLLNESNLNDNFAFKAAVKKYQEFNGLKPIDGICGLKTSLDLSKNVSFKKYLPDQYINLNTVDAKNKFIELYSKIDLDEGFYLYSDNEDFMLDSKLESLESIQFEIEEFPNNSFSEDGINYIVLHGKNFYEIKMKNDNNGFVIKKSRKGTDQDYDYIYQKDVSNLSTNETKIIHFGAITDNSFHLQNGKVSENKTMKEDREQYVVTLLNELADQIQHDPQIKDVIIASDYCSRSSSNDNSNSMFIENELFDFPSKRLNPQYVYDYLIPRIPQNINIILGGDLEKDVASIPNINSPVNKDNVTAITSQKSFLIQDEIVSKLKLHFTRTGIEILDLDDLTTKFDNLKANIILITGNNDGNFWDYVNHVAENADMKGKVLITFTCFQKGSEVTNSFLIKEYGLNSIIYFSTEIDPSAVKKVLLKLSELLNNNAENKSLKLLLNQAIEESYQLETLPTLKEAIDKLRPFRIQTSFIFKTLTTNNS